MKEILRYLRTTHNYTQETIACKLGITRQSYIKYENGDVVPSDKMVTKLAATYNVDKQFIYSNKIPAPYELYPNLHPGDIPLIVDSPDAPYPAVKAYDAFFDGTAVRVLNPSFSFKKGQRFKLVIEDDGAEEEKFNCLSFLNEMQEKYAGKFEFDDDDPYYKKAIGKAIEEKYGFTH